MKPEPDMSQYEPHTDLNPSNDQPPKPAGGGGLPPRPAQPGVGQRLKGAREQSGQELRHVSEALNIRYPYLQAIEDGAYDRLPGTAYALGFLRTYSQYLGLDSRELVRQFKAETSGLRKHTQLVFPTPQPESRIPSGAIILITVVLFGVVYGLWSYLSQDETAVADLIPAIPERLQPLVLGGLPAETDSQMETPAASEVVAAVPQPFGLGSDEPLTGVPGDAREILPLPDPVVSAPDPVSVLPDPTAEPPEGLQPAQMAESQVAESDAQAQPQSQAEPASGLESAPPQEAAVTSSEPVQSGPLPVEETAEPPAVETAAQATAQDRVEAPRATQSAALPETGATAGSNGETVPMTLLPSPDVIPSAPSTEGATQVFQDTEPRTYGAENTDARVIVRATQDSWVQVRDGEDSLLLTRLLRAGDSYRVPNRPGLTMLTGNAGGLELEVDGTALGPLGAVGKVRRDISLDPGQLLPAESVSQ